MTKEQILGTYTILEQIGSGSGGTVFKAYHNRLEQIVVLKRLNNYKNSYLNSRKEVDILKNLKHSYLPQVLDFIQMDDAIYTVMSFVPGKSLQQLLKEGRWFTKQELLRWGMEICSALNYLHTQSTPIIHGDIKPSNIMLTPEGDICLIDFNISFFLDENTVLGYTDGYTSPEQYLEVFSKRSKKSSRFVIDEKSDIYSVGATLYHLATGKKRSDFHEEMSFDELSGSLGEPFANVIKKAVDIEPDRRYDSAFHMFEAMESIPRKDKRYKELVRRQQILAVLIGALFIFFVGISAFGFSLMLDKRYEEYSQIVDRQTVLIDKSHFKKAEKHFINAREKMPSQLEAYYQNARSLHLQAKYAECIDFIEHNILEEKRVEDRARMVDVYALKALSHMELGEAAAAVEEYERAIGFGAFDNAYYRDYAIALAYNGQSSKAKRTLADAQKFGMDDGSIHYTKGEIHYALNEKDEALEELDDCIKKTEDDYMKMRAYLLESKIYEEKHEQERNRDVLLAAREDLPKNQQMVILEQLVQADIDLAEDTGDNRYRLEAIDTLHTIIDSQWGTYENYDTLAVLYQKENNLTQAAAVLQTMTDLYGEDYNINKRYALMEAERQNALPQQARNYSKFLQYYELAEKQYYSQLQDNHSDAEMGLLQNVKDQLQTGGWI